MTEVLTHPIFPVGSKERVEAIDIVKTALFGKRTPAGDEVKGNRSQYWHPENADVVIVMYTDTLMYSCWIFEPPTQQDLEAAASPEVAELMVGPVIGCSASEGWADPFSAFRSAMADMIGRNSSAMRRFRFQ
jgi:hypothetical protein